MTTPRTILRDSAIALTVLVGACLLVGVGAALTVLASGLMALANFAALAWAVSQLMGDDRRYAGLATGVLMLHGGVLIGGFAMLMSTLDPVLVGLGASAVVLGALSRGLADAFVTPALMAEEV